MKIETILVSDNFGKETEHVIIWHNETEFTSMLKSTYDAMQTEQSTPSLTDEAKTK